MRTKSIRAKKTCALVLKELDSRLVLTLPNPDHVVLVIMENYTTRIAHLTGSSSGGLNGSYLLNRSTVHADAAVNYLYGSAGWDWYFAGIPDQLFNKTFGEVITQV